MEKAEELLKPHDTGAVDILPFGSEELKVLSALDILEEEFRSPRITTFSKSIDSVLSGGIHLRKITELCGPPGSGKTQMCIQLCVNVRIPKSLGGLHAECIFIDTRSGFSVNRIKEIADACVTHCHNLAQHYENENMKEELKIFSTDDIMKSVHYLSVTSIVQLMAALHLAENLCENNEIRLLVVDSVTFPFLHSDDVSVNKTRVLSIVLDMLLEFITKYPVAVVLTNQLSTHIISPNDSYFGPSCGESFGHRMNFRIMLESIGDGRYGASLFKSSSQPNNEAVFQVDKRGIRDSIVS